MESKLPYFLRNHYDDETSHLGSKRTDAWANISNEAFEGCPGAKNEELFLEYCENNNCNKCPHTKEQINFYIDSLARTPSHYFGI